MLARTYILDQQHLSKYWPNSCYLRTLANLTLIILFSKMLKIWSIGSSIPPLWLMYVGERRTTFAKAYGIKVRCYWEHFGGTCEEFGNSLVWHTPPPTRQKRGVPSLHDATTHRLHGNPNPNPKLKEISKIMEMYEPSVICYTWLWHLHAYT
jgi:hypothetical protein